MITISLGQIPISEISVSEAGVDQYTPEGKLRTRSFEDKEKVKKYIPDGDWKCAIEEVAKYLAKVIDEHDMTIHRQINIRTTREELVLYK